MGVDTKAKHTKGIWVVEKAQDNPDCFGISAYEDLEAKENNEAIWTELATVYVTGDDEGKANAKLIAAAPDLLQVAFDGLRFLKEGKGYCNSYEEEKERFIKQMEKAISKATE